MIEAANVVKRLRPFLGIVYALLALHSAAQTAPESLPVDALVPAKSEEGKWGFQDRDGEFRIPPQFERVKRFSEGLAPVALHKKFGYVDTSGRVVIAPQFVNADPFSDGLALVYTTWGMNIFGRTEGWDLFRRAGYIDHSGKFVIGPRFVENASSFWEGVVAFQPRGVSPGNAKWGYLDKSGKWTIKPQYDVAGDFSEGLAAVAIWPKKGANSQSWGPWGYIDHAGEFVIPLQFRAAHPFKNGVATVSVWNEDASRPGSRRKCIDKQGRFVRCPSTEPRPTAPVGSRPIRTK
jgi:hypothetical protein